MFFKLHMLVNREILYCYISERQRLGSGFIEQDSIPPEIYEAKKRQSYVSGNRDKEV